MTFGKGAFQMKYDTDDAYLKEMRKEDGRLYLALFVVVAFVSPVAILLFSLAMGFISASLQGQ